MFASSDEKIEIVRLLLSREEIDLSLKNILIQKNFNIISNLYFFNKILIFYFFYGIFNFYHLIKQH